jgi:hypothetical protein
MQNLYNRYTYKSSILICVYSVQQTSFISTLQFVVSFNALQPFRSETYPWIIALTIPFDL